MVCDRKSRAGGVQWHPVRSFAARPVFAGLLLALGLIGQLHWSTGAAAEVALPRTADDLIAMVRAVSDTRDFERFKELVYWKGAGKIKRRVVRFRVRSGFGRPIKSITFEELKPSDLAGLEQYKHRMQLNMPVSHRLRVIYDEPPLANTDTPPSTVFLVGQLDGAYRIALVVRIAADDDDD